MSVSKDHLQQGSRVPLLSICIPTYCRADYLRETLESVILSCRGFEEEIEIIVSDNASTDHTSEVVSEIGTRITNFLYTKNEINVGAEMNFFQVLQMAKGKYVWVLGDDDKIDQRLIPLLIERLRPEPDLVIMNHSVHSRDFSITHKRAIHSEFSPELYHGKEVILSSFGPVLSFISCVIMKREHVLTISEEKYRSYAPYGLSFLYSVYACLPENAKTHFIQQPLVFCRGDNSSTAALNYEKFFIDGMALVLDSLRERGYSQKAITRAKTRVIKMYLLQYLVRLKRERYYSIKTFRRIHAGFSHCLPTYLLVMIYSVTPSFVVRMAKSFQSILKNNNSYSAIN